MAPMRLPRAVSLIAIASCVAALGCGDGEPEHRALWIAPDTLSALEGEHFFDAPWPSDLRLEHGAPRLDGYVNPRGQPILTEYIGAMRGTLDGFSPVAAGYLRFDGPIDPATLPADPAAAQAATSSVQLLDIDPASPEHGQRRPIALHWREGGGVYWQPDTLAFMPTLGAPLRPRTRYALVVTDDLRAAGGGTLGASDDLRQVLGLDPTAEGDTGRISRARDALDPALSAIEAAGISRDHLVHLTVFTTSDPTAEMFALRDHLVASVPAPRFRPSSWRRIEPVVDPEAPPPAPTSTEYIGQYGPSPNYQFGKSPFTTYGDGGDFRYENGEPRVEGLYDFRFSLTVPLEADCPMPDAGYPIVLYAHGTGGSYRSYVHDGTARTLAAQCLATMGVDQIFHGTRWGAPDDDSTTAILFFNFMNITAARTNTRQSALDEVQRARLFSEAAAVIPASVSISGKEILFDKTRVMFFGHSQGGLNGPLFLAADNAVRGAVLSGSSAQMAITLLEKTEPSPSVATAVKTIFLGLTGDDGAELNEFHPAISLAQSIVDVVDPVHYAASIVREPRPGFAPKSIYMTEGVNPDGIGDSYAPPRGIEVHAIAMGLPLQAPGQYPPPDARWAGPAPVTIPADGLAGNLADRAASGVLAQWPVPADSDGHFVIFRVPEARQQATTFLRNLASDPVGRVPAP
ncbi:hypothetical protein [Chondromyces apiculatus]|uniref:Bacterial virulence factor lipase N-terminal domain-containing protein n=1 Tax=Chondromyces apiculatus DSM 436 TaxID=1192034 RepID=A0A017SUP2_9BACT|nr:hypothetical protein [Chondromyces apiculatus]EYF00330.1 Hypothetical protein CAP_0942 [Chondromyces apiculatus DSM 436]